MYKTLSAPLSAQIEITSLCNNKCLHCYNFWRKDEGLVAGRKSMSVNEVRSVFQKLSDSNIFAVTITGGEPLLNKNGLTACLEEASRLNIEVSINSNLTLLNEKILYGLKRLGLKSFLTSILGPSAEIHDGITQKKGSFNALMSGIRLCLGNQIRVSPNMVISRKNIAYLRQTAELIHSLGINTFFQQEQAVRATAMIFQAFRSPLNNFAIIWKRCAELTTS